MRNVQTLMHEPIAGCPMNFSSLPILWKSSGNPNHVSFGQCRNAEINSSSSLISTCSCSFKKSPNPLLWLIYNDNRWSATTTKVPLFPSRGSPTPNSPASRTTRMRFMRAARSPTPSSRSAHNATTQWTQTLRRRQPKRNRILINQLGAVLQQSDSKTWNLLFEKRLV